MNNEEHFFLSIFKAQNLMHMNEVKINIMNPPHCQRPCVSFLIFVWLLFSVCFGGGGGAGGRGSSDLFIAPTSEGQNIPLSTVILDYVEMGLPSTLWISELHTCEFLKAASETLIWSTGCFIASCWESLS